MTVAQLSEELRESHRTATARRVVGRGTWLDAGRPVAAGASPLDLGRLRGITEYVPGDLTLTALAGTPLAELHEATRAHGQRLALDPYGTDDGSLGATVATASAGPAAGTFGTPRDQVLGITFVTGTGDVVRAGGRVVKNVAGFDLVRLTIGAWGTLGVVAEVSVRLRALPAADETFCMPLDAADDAAVAAATHTLRSLPFTFEALELLDAATVRAVGLVRAAQGAIVARATGSPAAVRSMRASLAPTGSVHEVDGALWGQLRALDAAGSACIRLSHASAHAAATWRSSRAFAAALAGRAQMSIARTVARITSASATVPALDGALAGFDGTIIAERLPAAAWTSAILGRRPEDDGTLQRLRSGVRDAFDPARLLNRGILGRAGGDA